MSRRFALPIVLSFLAFLSLFIPSGSHAINVAFNQQIGAEKGSASGRFYEPTGIAVSADGIIHVVDSENNRVQMFDAQGKFMKAFGSKGKGDGQFRIPFGIAIGTDGRLFVTDSGNSRVQVFNKDGGFLYGFGRDGSRDGELSEPLGIAADNQDRIFIADSGNHRVSVFTSDGLFLDSFGARGEGKAQFNSPAGIAVSPDNRIWIADTGNNRIQIFDGHGNPLSIIGAKGSGRDAFSRPTGIAVDPSGLVVIADSDNHRLQLLDSKAAMLGPVGSRGSGRAQFSSPQLVYMWAGLCYIADTENNRVQVLALTQEQGAPSLAPFKKSPTETRFSYYKTIPASIADIAVDSRGRLIALDKDAARILFLDMDGKATGGFGGKGKKQGMFNSPSGFAIDEKDNIYVSDTGNDRVQVFDSGGEYLFEFGGSGSKDGKFDGPAGIIYAKGKIIAADTGNNRIQIFSRDGIYLGQFGKSGSEDGMLKQPVDVAVNSRGEIYVADYGNARVQLFSADGKFLKVAARKGEGRGELTGPKGILVDIEDRLFVLDSYKRNRVLVFDAPGKYLRGFGSSGAGRMEMEKAAGISLLEHPDSTYIAIADGGNRRLHLLSLKDAPSKAPENPRIEIEGSIVRLSWSKAPESFVKGYKIYAARNAESEFRPVAETVVPLFNLAYTKESQSDAAYGITIAGKGGLEGPMAVVYPLGFLLYTQNDFVGAIRELERAIKIDPKNIEAYLLLGRSLNAVGKSGEAMNALKTALEINKDDVNVLIGLGQIYLDSNLIDKAIDEFQGIIAKFPKEALAHNLLGKAFLKKRMYTEAIDALAAAARINPADKYKQDLNAAYEERKRIRPDRQSAPVEIQGVAINNVFSSLYKFYTGNPIGAIRITNNSSETFPKIKISLKVLNYMDFPTDREVKNLKPGSTEAVPLLASFNNRILEIVEDTPAQAAIEVSYYVDQKEEKTTQTIPFTIYNRNAITWTDPAMAGSFVTPKDEPVKEFARGLAQMYPDSPVMLNRQMASAMLIFDALGAYGIVYSPDPNNPYEKVSTNVSAIDSMQYPRETLKIKSGDCDDLSVLISALLENLGIETAFLGTPGHLFLMFKLDIDPKNADAISLNPEQYVKLDNHIWIPVEATAVGASFNEAWYKGSEIYNRWINEKKVEVTKVHEAWPRYQPATLPPAVWSPALPSREKIDSIVAKEIGLQKSKKIMGLLQPYKAAAEKNPKDLHARLQIGIIYAENEFLAEATKEFSDIIAIDPGNVEANVNLGNVYLLTGKIESAIERYKKAEDALPGDAEIKINIAIAYYKKGTLKEAQEKFKEAAALQPSVKYERSFLDSLLFR